MSTFLDTIFQWLPRLRRPDQTLSDAQCDAQGRLLVSVPAAVTIWVDPALGTPLAASRLAVSGPSKLHQAYFENTGGATRWLQFFDQTTAPVNGAAPLLSLVCSAGQGGCLELRRPRAFVQGVYWVVSSSAGTLTVDNTATVRVHLEVEV